VHLRGLCLRASRPGFRAGRQHGWVRGPVRSRDPLWQQRIPICVGVSHRQASIAALEGLSVPAELLPDRLRQLRELPGVPGPDSPRGGVARYRIDVHTGTVVRVVAAIASVLLSAHSALPVVLACCDSPAAHACCAKSKEAGVPQVGRAPCCRSDSKATSTRRDNALASSLRMTLSAPAPAPLTFKAILSVETFGGERFSSLGDVRSPGPPVPLRI